MKKLIVCLTGVINRSIKYTWDSIKDNIIDQLKKEYEVDIAVFNNNVEDCKVDGVKINNNDMSIIPYNFIFEYKQTFIDSEIVKIDGYDKEFPPYYSGKFKKNGFRLMYIESKVADFLEKNKDVYKYALITNADYFYVNKFNLDCLKHLNLNEIGTCHHLDAGGYTDGFYIGQLNTIYKIMNRINYYKFLITNEKYASSYEKQLKYCFIYNNNIQRFKIDILFVKIRANKNIAGSHMNLWAEPIKKLKEYLKENKSKYGIYDSLL